MPKKRPSRLCPGQHQDCFAFGPGGKCRICIDTNFHAKECPFFKTSYQRKHEHLATVEKLTGMDQDDLLEKYGGGEEQAKLWESI